MAPTRTKTYLRKWREHRGLSLQKVADALGMKEHTTLSRVERGLYAYNQDLLEKLATLYDCEPADLIVRDPAESPTIYSTWDQANETERRQIARVAAAVVGFRVEGDR